MLHVCTPSAVVRQQLTNPGLPHVDLAAQLMTESRHVSGSLPARIARRTTCAAHRTYARWVPTAPQSHCAVTSARAFARARGCVQVCAGSVVVDVVVEPPGWTTAPRTGMAVHRRPASVRQGRIVTESRRPIHTALRRRLML